MMDFDDKGSWRQPLLIDMGEPCVDSLRNPTVAMSMMMTTVQVTEKGRRMSQEACRFKSPPILFLLLCGF